MSMPDSTTNIQTDTTPTDTAAAATSVPDTAPAADADATAGSAPAPMSKEEIDAAAASAFDAGIEAELPKDAADVAATAAAAAAPAPAAAASPAAAPAPAPAKPLAKGADADTDKAVLDLGLKGKAEARFREMAGTIKELAPVREALTKHGITDQAKLDDLVQNSARAVEWENTVLASTATPEQFGSALNVIKAINSGDPKVMNVAFDSLLNEVTALGKKLGREVAGLIDPLESHADLREGVEAGDITRKLALEMAAQRATAARTAEVNTTQQQAVAHQQAVDAAMVQIDTLNTQLKSADPDFARKLPFLQPALDTIRASMHPSRWAEAIHHAYTQMPALPPLAVAAPVKPPISHIAARTTDTSAALAAKPRNDMEAFELGLQSVGQ